jgi:hypothetical protein
LPLAMPQPARIAARPTTPMNDDLFMPASKLCCGANTPKQRQRASAKRRRFRI